MVPGLKGTQASVHLDLIRGLAAVEVLLYHSFGVFFVDRSDPGKELLYVRALRLIVGYGHESVVAFFVLSGLLISASVIQDVRSGRWSWRRYAVARATRTYLVLAPVLVLTYALDRAGLALFAGRVDVADPGNFWVSPERIRGNLDARAFLGNLFFLQTILVGTLGSNGSLWSLANEGWYYVIFPCLWLAVEGRSGWRGRSAFGAAGAAALVLVGPKISLYFTVWLLGTAVCLLCPGRPGPRASRLNAVAGPALVLAALFGGTNLRWRYPGIDFAMDFAAGVAVAVLLYGFLSDPRPEQAGAYASVSRTVAGFSFTLYAVHIPILVFTRLCLSPARRWQPDPPHVASWLLIVAGVLVCAYGLSRLTEAHTDAVRRYVLGLRRPGHRWGGPRPPAGSPPGGGVPAFTAAAHGPRRAAET